MLWNGSIQFQNDEILDDARIAQFFARFAHRVVVVRKIKIIKWRPRGMMWLIDFIQWHLGIFALPDLHSSLLAFQLAFLNAWESFGGSCFNLLFPLRSGLFVISGFDFGLMGILQIWRFCRNSILNFEIDYWFSLFCIRKFETRLSENGNYCLMYLPEVKG